jgi:DNA-binding NarL/FixJ family response regulator
MDFMQILIVDDNEMVRRGVSALLSSRPAWQVCGYAGDGKEALRKAKELRRAMIFARVFYCYKTKVKSAQAETCATRATLPYNKTLWYLQVL